MKTSTMKTSTMIAIGALAVGAYFLFRRGGQAFAASGDTTPLASSPVLQTVYKDASGATQVRTQPFKSVPEGIAYLNQAWSSGERIVSPGATLVPQNTRFVYQGQNYATGANQTVSRLGDGSIKVLSVRSISPSSSPSRTPTTSGGSVRMGVSGAGSNAANLKKFGWK